MKRIFGVWMLIVLVVFSCGSPKKKAPPKDTCICILFDLSGSTQKTYVRKAYSKAAKKIMAEVAPGDVLVVGLITEVSLSEPRFCVEYAFHVFKPTTDNSLIKRVEKKAFLNAFRVTKDSLMAIIDSTLFDFHTLIPRTEIMGALQVASRVFKNYGYKNNDLIIFSDMIEDSQYYNFKLENLDRRRIRQIIKREKRRGRLPDLVGVHIYVVGAYEEGRYQSLRTFWQAYFESSGAAFKPKNYGTILIKFDK